MNKHIVHAVGIVCGTAVLITIILTKNADYLWFLLLFLLIFV